ncbi:biotin--[acetyl-CoA-carboxylase] ligase [uncultured Nocardioides sp.]|uniref:biotin--[acetyl-CoA-carboxylase] ligase n=1 Tax=uncultured Nocardioides sp. TaxID=198441 RepID=UPI0026330DB1|nr:biotin--[acetyl-CoA-carboxylase] ligase [uncultured Nocardioides sp.]
MTDPSEQRPPVDNPLDPVPLAELGVEVLPQTPSTNAVLAERARAGAPEGLVVATEHQTAGRGRLDRTWETPAGTALTFSTLLRPQVPAATWPWLPLLTGYAVAKSLAAAGFAAVLKWPNDVLIGDRKVAGILVERVETPDGPAAVVGIGLNVLLAAEQLPVPTATSLLVESAGLGHPVPDRTVLLASLVQGLLETYGAWQAGIDGGAVARLRESYTRVCGTVGRDVEVALPDGNRLVGRASGIDEHGRLVVAPAAGPEVPVGAGDVVHVRPA